MIKYKRKSILHRLAARFRNKPIFYKALEVTGNELKGKKWIFILGCYNSGTTLLNQILADHPEISGLPDEGVMLTSELVKPEDFGWRRMWWKCYDLIKANQNISIRTAQKIKKHWSHFYKDTPYLVEKSISNVCRIPFLESDFKEAYFIHIVRNGYAVAEGIQRKAEIIAGNEYEKLGKYPLDICAQQWVESLKMVEEKKESLTNFIEITYEDFTGDPDSVLDQITSFLGTTRFSEKISQKSFSVHEKNSAVKNMNPRSISNLSQEEISVINATAGEYLTKYNYLVL